MISLYFNNFETEKRFDANQTLIVRAIFEERLANSWSNHDVAVKFFELSGSNVSYHTLLRHYESLNRPVPLQPPSLSQTKPKPVHTSNRFDILNNQPDNIEIEQVIANPSKIQ